MKRYIQSFGLVLLGILTGCNGPSFTIHKDAQRTGSNLGVLRGVILDSVSGDPFTQIGASLHFHGSAEPMTERRISADNSGAFQIGLIPNGVYAINQTESDVQDCPNKTKFTGCFSLRNWSKPDCKFEIKDFRILRTDPTTGQTFIFVLAHNCNYPDYIFRR